MEYREWMEDVTRGFEVVGVVIIAVGAVAAGARAAINWPGRVNVFEQVRHDFGRALILGLEVLVAADVIETVTVERTLESIIGLGILVLVRIMLSFSLDVELDGMWPWREAEFKARHPSSSE